MNKVCRNDGKFLDNVLITGAMVVDPVAGTVEPKDILLKSGRIDRIGRNLSGDGRRVVSADGLVIMPGLVDMHTHLREPGYEHKEDIASGSAAAAAGGFTVITAMPNTDPALDHAQMIEFVIDRGRSAGLVDVRPIGAISKGRQGEELAPIGELVDAGAVAVSDDGNPVKSSELMRCALQYTKMFGIPVINHCQDMELTDGGQMNFGFVANKLGLRGMPAEAEEIMVARDLLLARLVKGYVHIAHVSTAGACELIRRAKEDGVLVTAEVTPHHLTLTEELVAELMYDPNTKVNPPLRTVADIEALIEGLKDGTIDAIATDHAPHHLDDKKCEYQVADFGISGLETAWPLVYTELVRPGSISLVEAVTKFSVNPARILGVDAGTLAEDKLADLVVFDPNEAKTCDPNEFLSKGKNSPLAGRELYGWPVATISSGRLVFGTGRLADLEALGGRCER